LDIRSRCLEASHSCPSVLRWNERYALTAPSTGIVRVSDPAARVQFSRNPGIVEGEIKAPKIFDGTSDYCGDRFFGEEFILAEAKIAL
jgi:hypothetical protein